MPPKKKAPEPEPEPVDEGPKEVRARSAGDVLRAFVRWWSILMPSFSSSSSRSSRF